jgi:hypothetical protein
LQDEVLFCLGIQGYQEGVIDIATPIFMDVNDRALWFELICSGSEIVQGLVLAKTPCPALAGLQGALISNIEYRTAEVFENDKIISSLRYSAVHIF